MREKPGMFRSVGSILIGLLYYAALLGIIAFAGLLISKA